jgi:allantoate deiminase
VTAFDPKPLGERAQAMIDALGAISAEPGRLTRLYLTPEHRRAADLVAEWMRRAGLKVRMDAAATMHGFLPAGRDGLRAERRLLVGSHIDTVIDAGRYDGPLGVVAGILAVEELRARGVALPFGLEILAFGDEEGIRFPKTLIGSSTVAGSIEKSILDMVDADGNSVGNMLLKFGADPAAIKAEAYKRADMLGYLEVHIEQGPQLERWNEPLGVVLAIASQSRHRIRIAGEQGHAGTIPMPLRHDALAAAAEFITMVEELALKGAKDHVVATVGEISVRPGAVNVIAGEAVLSLDVRAASDKARAVVVETIRQRARQIGLRRGVIIGIETVHEKPEASCVPRLRNAIGKTIREITGRKAPELLSGAGHDGLAMAQLTEIGMIFVRCRAGISHNPLEHVSIADLGLAVEALTRTVLALASE